mgnify:CR=1 FL=1
MIEHLDDNKPYKKEKDLHKRVIDICDREGYIYFHGAMALPTFRTPGEPDFVILLPQGKFILIECKSISGRLKPSQKDLFSRIEKIGHKVYIIKTVKELYGIIKQYK